MIYLIITLLILFYMFYTIIKIHKRKIDELMSFLNNVQYADLKSGIIEGNKKDR